MQGENIMEVPVIVVCAFGPVGHCAVGAVSIARCRCVCEGGRAWQAGICALLQQNHCVGSGACLACLDVKRAF